MGRAVWGVGVLCVAVGLGILLWRVVVPPAALDAASDPTGQAAAPSPPDPPSRPAAPAVPPLLPTPRPAPSPPQPLPALDDSDALVREQGGTLSRTDAFAGWLEQGTLVRRFVAAVDNVADGRSPRRHLAFLAPQSAFAVAGESDAGYARPETWRRWDAVGDVVASLDAVACARFFERFEPLLDDALRELGHPDGGFRGRLQLAIAELLGAPSLVGEPVLVQPVYSWAYADPALESLSDAQKHLLRLGPRNAPRVQEKLREIAAALGIRTGALPEPYTVRLPARPAG